jgi:NitT/TauT family transport system substrate-binding protein
LHSGLGDAYVTDLLGGLTLAQQGAGAIALRLAQAGGVMPNSVYYTKRGHVDELRDRLERFMAAIASSMRELDDDGDAARAEAPIIDWPDAEPTALAAAVEELQRGGTWSSSRIDPAACERWTGILYDAGLLAQPVAHAEIVDDSVMDAVEAGASLTD